MKTLLLGGNPGFWHHTQRPHDRDIMSGIESWVFAFDGDHCNTLDATTELINRYDLIIGNTNRGIYRPKLLELQRTRKKGIRWVTLIEACATGYLAMDSVMKELLDGSDLVNVINRHTLNFFRSSTTARCEYIGIPYPAATIRNKFQPGNRTYTWIPSNLYHANASWSSAFAALPVTKKFGAECHGFFRKDVIPKHRRSIFSIGSQKQQQQALHPLLHDVIFHHEMDMPSYFRTISGTAHSFVNLDHRFTWARDVLDCAAFQIPCIGTVSTGHVQDFFPDLVVPNEFAVREGSQLLERLYSDKEFYNSTRHVPIELLEPLSHRNMKQKLFAALNL